MSSPRHIWIIFLLCLAIVTSAMGWMTVTALRVDRAEVAARRRAAREENVRLALWRMDSTLGPLVAQESARPYFVYSPFLPIDRSYNRMLTPRDGGEVVIPSPLLGNMPPNVLVHFQFEPDGRFTSPQVPVGANRKLAMPQHTSQEAVELAQSRLDEVAGLVDRRKLTAMLPAQIPKRAALELVQRTARQADLQRRGRGAIEFDVRNQAVTQQMGNFILNSYNNALLAPADVTGVLMTPLWIDGQLILARRVTAGGQEYLQGCLLDWPAIRVSLLSAVEDLLPGADLQPATAAAGNGEARRLAALPVRLVPGTMPENPAAGPEAAYSPTVLSLATAWTCLLLAAVAVALLLLGVMRLSERRAAFVSAVTHELRTPLTTFQMYAEMLAEGMISDRDQQQDYLNTLRSEALRLTHLVENVLAYARLERGRTDGRLDTVAVDRLIESTQKRLADRAQEAGMELVIEADASVDGVQVRANVSAVEQILLNLVDNACKYASNESDKRLHLAAHATGKTVEVSLRDHGPGVSESVRRRLFDPFSKSVQQAAQSAPGVGLGLSLSRRLARDMGGELRLDDPTNDGARFVLTLPSDL